MKIETTHLAADFYGILDQNKLNNRDFCLAAIFDSTAAIGKGLNLTTHILENNKINVVATSSNCQSSLQTYPEKNYCAIDLYGAEDLDLQKGIDCLISKFNPKKIQIVEFKRGRENETSK